MEIILQSTYLNFKGPIYNAVSSVLRELLCFSGLRVQSHQFYPPDLTFSGKGSWSSPTFWPAPSSQHPQVD